MMQENEKEANSMPKVGNKEFPYTPEGIAAAQAESQDTGIPISNGAQRNIQNYAGSGNTGFAGIGKPLDITQGVGNVGMEPEVLDMYKEGGKVKKGESPKKQRTRKMKKIAESISETAGGPGYTYKTPKYYKRKYEESFKKK